MACMLWLRPSCNPGQTRDWSGVSNRPETQAFPETWCIDARTIDQKSIWTLNYIVYVFCRFGIGILYPTFKSFEAIESSGSRDDTQWLTYWVVFSFINLTEKLLWVVLMWCVSVCFLWYCAWMVCILHGYSNAYSDDVLYFFCNRIPLYGVLKIGLLFWLASPQFKGATMLYGTFIKHALRVMAEHLKTIPAFEDYVKPFLEGEELEIKKKTDEDVKQAEPAVKEALPESQAGPMGSSMQ